MTWFGRKMNQLKVEKDALRLSLAIKYILKIFQKHNQKPPRPNYLHASHAQIHGELS